MQVTLKLNPSERVKVGKLLSHFGVNFTGVRLGPCQDFFHVYRNAEQANGPEFASHIDMWIEILDDDEIARVQDVWFEDQSLSAIAILEVAECSVSINFACGPQHDWGGHV